PARPNRKKAACNAGANDSPPGPNNFEPSAMKGFTSAFRPKARSSALPVSIANWGVLPISSPAARSAAIGRRDDNFKDSHWTSSREHKCTFIDKHVAPDAA